MSDRVQVNITDNSGFTKGATVIRGATVLRSPKGTEEPMLFEKGNTLDILQRLGYPSASYPDIWEAIEFNKQYALWISAPSNSGLHAGIIYDVTGAIPMTVGSSDPSTFDFASVDYTELIGTGNGVLTNFTASLTQNYKNLSLSSIVVGSTPITVSVTDAEPEVISGVGISAGTMTRATSAIDVTFSAAPADGDAIYAVYQTDLSATAYFALFEKSPHAQTVKTKVTYSTVTGFFTIEYYITDNRSIDKLVDSYEVSQIPGTVNGQKENIYIDDYFAENNYLISISNDLVYTTFVADTAAVALGAGSRGATITLTELTAGWAYFEEARNYPANIFMDFTADAGIPDIFDDLRSNQCQYKDFILPLPDNQDATAAAATKSGYSINERGLSFYWNWKKIKEPYNSTIFWTCQIGSVAVKWADMFPVYNGLAPAMVDENGYGGQLSGSVLAMRYDPDDDTVAILADAGINAIIFDPDYGAMITNHRTGQTPAVLSDTSFISHSRAFDYCISNIIRQVLVFQLTKLNDNYHQTQVRTKTEAILNPLVAKSIFREIAVKCDDENNTDAVKAKRQFKLGVAVKVTPTSEWIILDFILSAQGVNVESSFT